MKIALLVIFISGLSEAFDSADFLTHCGTTYVERSYFSRTLKCATCKNVKISEEDSESFITEKFNILNEECVVFKNSNLGIVNGDFFKQFPKTKVMIMTGVELSLKPSENLLVNSNYKYLEIEESDIKDNNHTNAFHSLIDLNSFALVSCNIQNTTIDDELLKMNSELRDLKLNFFFMPRAHIISDNALVNLINLKRMSIGAFNMSRLSDTFFEDKPDLTFIELIGQFEKFPQNLPYSLQGLVIQFSEFQSLTKQNLMNLKEITKLSLTQGSLEHIELNAFDDLENLQDLDLTLNEIKMFSERHLKNNWKIAKVILRNNPLDTRDLVLGHGLEEYSKGRFYNY